MTPHDLMKLRPALLGTDGAPRCAECTKYVLNADAAPVMTVDETEPAVCTCPKCGSKAQTPAALAIAVLAKQIADLKAVWMAEQLARDPIGQAMVAARIRFAVGEEAASEDVDPTTGENL